MTDVDETSSAGTRGNGRTRSAEPSQSTASADASSEVSGTASGGDSVEETASGGSSFPERTDVPYAEMGVGGGPKRSAFGDNRASKYNLRGQAELQATRSWKEVSGDLARSSWDALPGEHDSGRADLFEDRTTLQMRKMLSDQDAFKASILDQLDRKFPNKSEMAILEKTQAISREANHAFGRKVSDIIGERAESMINRASAMPERINEDTESRRQFMAKLARQADGDRDAIERGLAKLGIDAEQGQSIASTLSEAHADGKLDEVADPNVQGPDKGWTHFEGAYHNADEALKAGLDASLEKFRRLRGQLDRRDMDKSGGEYTNLVNRNFNKTRRAVLDKLDIGSLEDDGLSAEGSGAEAALQDYREKLTTADTATEKVTAAYKWTADQLTGGKEEAAQFAVETIVAYQDKQMAEFAAEHAGTADGAAVADADAELKGLAAEEAASRAVDFVLPSPDIGPDGAPKTAEELRDVAVEHLYDEAASAVSDRAGESAGGAVEREVENKVRSSNL